MIYNAKTLRDIAEGVNEKSRQQAQKGAMDYANNVLASKLRATAQIGHDYYHIYIPNLPCNTYELVEYLKQNGYTIDFDMTCTHMEISW